MTVRERIEQMERESLSPNAALSAESRGRVKAETPCPVRTCFQRDRDRIIHLCGAFRRLAHKTQVFMAPREDHIRTRLSHTLEVSQVARTVAKALRLNEDLTEAIALAHDVGHTPFGHSGEAALNEAYRKYDRDGSFAHAVHSLRIVDELERDGAGLNLTHETRDGIVRHSKKQADLAVVFAQEPACTLEALVVSVADRLAYLNHDLDDCLHAKLLTHEDLPRDLMEALGWSHSARVGTMVEDLITHSLGESRLAMSPEVLEATDDLKQFMYETVYMRVELMEDRERVRGIVFGLFDVYMTKDAALFAACGYVPDDAQRRARLVCDYIAGMTDRYAKDQYIRFFLPSSFPL
jgi:dGTPase